ncbi:unnamed protein product, partial [Phaeothamnion confervicola]
AASSSPQPSQPSQPQPPRISESALRASVDRLAGQKPQHQPPVAARDYDVWKRRRGLDPTTKVFVLTGWYPCVREALLARGWHENPSRDSPFFDLKWTLHSSEVKATDLSPGQAFNHFLKNVAVTTKAGLLSHLRSLRWFADADVDDVFPRAYDLSLRADAIAFVEDFQATAAEALLRHVLLRATGPVAL